ncbi:MAG: hypothetical protein A3F24_00500 [Candidatus Colwellbacteria bacterium RIFCSPHIGHO2_12_FULL_44_17]|uniref:N-end rule aminoacyl transferase C-terminal domain-containing protein n=1 Tax=Candidatus Colwellbacteria bacterium RIFCSPHIGHO2_12_FULL_44_17 TaxID=1797689 RepID=A0A1G1Z6E3_9BACT|nr:MAG: hypothetical protein A3F24_00500 [Candidatus Colwellbacteria bacterium RIFCSPHIGHO2_12_FULL_44_17]
MYKFSDEKTVKNPSEENIDALYKEGFVATRLGKEKFQQIKSLRVRLNDFKLSSENRRVLKNNEDIKVSVRKLPFENYSWQIGKLGLDFYTKKFGKKIMTANKLRELFTDPEQSSMNIAFVYQIEKKPIGYCLALETKNIIHYSYPFYDLTLGRSLGMAMMLKAIQYAKENQKEYIYLGSSQKYKEQFKGLEVFDPKHGWTKV